MIITFDKLPNNLEELKAMPQASLNEPEYGAALFLAVMMHYYVNKDETYEMLEYLKGPYGLSTYEKQFLADRMADGEHIVRSFFILLRHKVSTNQWFIEDQMLLAMIRAPKSQDPWA